MSLFVSQSDLEFLTGSPRTSRQLEWLAAHGYPHEINLAGKPVVLRAEVETRLHSGKTRRRISGPDLSAMDAA